MRHKRGQTETPLLWKPLLQGGISAWRIQTSDMDDISWPTGKKDSPFLPFMEQYPERPLSHHSEYTNNLHDHLDFSPSCRFSAQFIWTLSDTSVTKGMWRVLQGLVKQKLCSPNGDDLDSRKLYHLCPWLSKRSWSKGQSFTWAAVMSLIVKKPWLPPEPTSQCFCA